jgi:hypothetical protein
LEFQESLANPDVAARTTARGPHYTPSRALRRQFALVVSSEHAGFLRGCSHTTNALATPKLVKAILL